LEKYKKILELTNVYRKDFDRESKIKGTIAYKYQKIIRPLIADKIKRSVTTLVKDDDSQIKKQPDSESLENYFNKLDKKTLQLDKTYGPKKINQTWYLGNKKMEFEGKYLIIDSEKFENSKGLIKLIFNSAPYDYTKEDLEKYKNILELTNVYRNDFDRESKIKGTNAYKYQKIIKPLIADKIKKSQGYSLLF
jgi:hypothetical protein